MPWPGLAGGEGTSGGLTCSLLAPDFPASLCSLRTEMDRIQQEQSKVRQSPGSLPGCEGQAAVQRRP